MTVVETTLIGGRFRLTRLLGSGSMGQVYLAMDERLQRPVAVKVLLPDGIDGSTVQRLEREARAAAAVQHANVVRVFDFLEDGGRTLIVMEYVEGETLADRIVRTGPMPYDEAVEVAAQVCDGLAAAHRLGLVHRDLKPANVLLTEDGIAKVLDFGIAKRTGHIEATLTQTGAVLGTPQYMAPEQLGGEEIDARVDVHAAGLLLYEMLAGKAAFGGGTIAQLMFQLVSEPPDLSILAARDVTPDVIAIIATALKKNRDDRWPTARMMAEALRVQLYGDVILTRRTPTPSGLRAISGAALRATPSGAHDVPTIAAVEAPPVSVAAATPPPRTRQFAIGGTVVAAVVAAVVFAQAGRGAATDKPALSGRDTIARAVKRDSAPGGVALPSGDASSRTNGAPDSGTRDSAAEKLTADVKADARFRQAFAASVQSRWRVYLPRIAAQLGPKLATLRSEFIVVVDQNGRLASVKPGELSNIQLFDESASDALQNVKQVRAAGARRTHGSTMRIQFMGQTVRARATLNASAP